MRGKYIDFISAYCDSWCERCQFTDRRSHYALRIALEMCDGDLREATELAVAPAPPRTAAEAKRRKERAEELANIPIPTDAEHAANEPPPELAAALDVARRDCFFIYVKLHRAQHGLDEATHGKRLRRRGIQTDWNGSARCRRRLEKVFPNAWKFHRSGFDGVRRLRW